MPNYVHLCSQNQRFMQDHTQTPEWSDQSRYTEILYAEFANMVDRWPARSVPHSRHNQAPLGYLIPTETHAGDRAPVRPRGDASCLYDVDLYIISHDEHPDQPFVTCKLRLQTTSYTHRHSPSCDSR